MSGKTRSVDANVYRCLTAQLTQVMAAPNGPAYTEFTVMQQAPIASGAVGSGMATDEPDKDNMELLKHDIAHEFPELKDKIHALKVSNTHFAKLYSEYDALNHEIVKVETGGAVMIDEALEVLKKQRLKAKDHLVQMLRA